MKKHQSKVLDKIKNPDIPGLEQILPPPPPRISVNPSESISKESHQSNRKKDSQANQTIPSPFNTNQPWWIPAEADNTEVYTQWYESAYKAALQAAQEKDPVGKPKVKYFKRKVEVIDAKVDAEKVANAQKELSALMKPLKCDLCNAVMNSTVQARLHYQGKPHQKKVSMYLNQSAKKMKLEETQVSSTTASNDWTTYCEICKIWFTSQTDASQHYSGKKHLKAAFGALDQKIAAKKVQSKIPEDPTGRFGIGTAFQPQSEVLPVVSEPLPVPIVIPPVPQYCQVPIPIPTPLRCEICGISANRQDQLDTHKRGAKHIKMMKQLGLPLTDEETGLASSNNIDYSIYRTPSGQYYCAPCNMSLNSEITFGQHMESKKHRNKVSPKSAEQPVASNKSKKK
ncbi:zinc finger matrin-type protein 3-like [Phymastichus coffea]|uniref:zinc finger matrin-type protein 3-like n=1 Tax=Phymastichus coffea TaxID=108790 RepID=UPI00273B3110|nr:zinc finger matrin-type protein 3-like [Phymastichus coffea]XP_058798783.1 zinc finger matrin-type protein 3-like [Phymastichus coffea]